MGSAVLNRTHGDVMVAASPRPKLRPLALPTEHGGWSFILEPIFLGLVVAGTWAGVLLSIAAFATFLIRHPLKLALKDTRRGKSYLRTTWAFRIAKIYGAVACIAGVLALVMTDHPFLQPLLLAIPLALVQLYFDASNRGRELIPEIFGAVALSSVAPMIALAHGWQLDAAYALWAILIARIITSILYVRARLRLERNEYPNTRPPQIAHWVGLVVVIGLVMVDLAPALAIIAMFILLARSLYGLSKWRKPAPQAKIIGIQEVIFGILTVLFVGIGYSL